MRRRTGTVLVALLVVVFWGVGFYRLGKFFGWDEVYWFYDRIPQLYEAIASGRWSATELSPHDLKPGILPSYLAGAGLTLAKGFLPGWSATVTNLLRAGRLPLLLFNGILLLLIFRHLRDLIGQRSALYTMGFLALNPILISLSRVMNPDSLLWSLSFLTFIFTHRYIRNRNWTDLLLWGTFLGLTMLTKIIGAVFYVYLPVMLLLDRSFHSVDHFPVDELKDCAIGFAVSVGVFGLLFPACWVNPLRALRGTIFVPGMLPVYFFVFGLYVLVVVTRMTAVAETVGRVVRENNGFRFLCRGLAVFVGFVCVVGAVNYYSGYSFFNPETYYVSVRSKGWILPASFWASSYVTLFTLPLVVVVGLAGSFFKLVSDSFDRRMYFLVGGALVFVSLYYTGSTIRNEILWPRYQAMIYPPMLFVAAVFWSRLENRTVTNCLLVAGLVFPLWYAFPFHFHYTSPLNTRDLVVTPTWGYGGYEVAQYINEQQRRAEEQFVVWTDNPGPIPFLETEVYRGPPFAKRAKTRYLILSHQGRRGLLKHRKRYEKGIKRPVTVIAAESPLLEYHTKEPEFEICLGGSQSNCMRVVRVKPEDYRRYDSELFESEPGISNPVPD